ncbi:MAG: helix-turn-helix domain-containing protein [Intrasporangium sp.]|uniref:ArsR/SmtB family transcription factor n=1 Tax=Intrasporangium sp. TaxID=1925024 RepID=UPI0026474BEA|nr:helix-turn-helix domain-containing protein [Intrasporangium sp.]MDN5795477.1 helix-turn-helix domain-containing protein [Intrasporangium sp.]
MPTTDSGESHAARLQRYRAMADPNRLAVLEALRIRGELTTSEFGRLLPHARGSMRHHLKVLEDAGLIASSGTSSWVEASTGALMTSTSPASEDSEEATVMRLLDFIVKHRRIGRIERWERERKDGRWPGWAENDLGRDYVVKFTLDELTALDEDLDRVVVSHREQAATRQRERGTEGEEIVFLTLLGFPFTLGE